MHVAFLFDVVGVAGVVGGGRDGGGEVFGEGHGRGRWLSALSVH